MTTIISVAAFIILALVVGIITLHFINFKQWLVWACAQAESEFGSDTGQLKLKSAYNKAIEKFPFIAKVIPFSLFSKWISEALVKLKEISTNNHKIAEILDNANNLD